MATGAGLGTLIPVAMSLVGIVTILRARVRRKAGRDAPDQTVEDRQAAAREMERRMASYLARGDLGDRVAVPDERESGR